MISRRAQQGQSLVLACLLILALSLCVLTILHVGHGVNEKIRLQNTADAAAYSIAVMEARAFNFYVEGLNQTQTKPLGYSNSPVFVEVEPAAQFRLIPPCTR